MSNRLTALRAALACLVSLDLASCASRPTPLLVTIRTVEDTVLLRRNPEVTFLKVTAVIRNQDLTQVYLSHCGPAAQREIDGNWVTVYAGPFCLGSGFFRVGQGDSAILPVEIVGYTTPHTGPRLDPRMTAGRYRLIFGVGLTDPWKREPMPDGSVYQVFSSPFIVRDSL